MYHATLICVRGFCGPDPYYEKIMRLHPPQSGTILVAAPNYAHVLWVLINLFWERFANIRWFCLMCRSYVYTTSRFHPVEILCNCWFQNTNCNIHNPSTYKI